MTRIVTDLGQAPWAFHLCPALVSTDLAAGRPVDVGGTATQPTYTVDLGAPRPIAEVRLGVDEPKVTDVTIVLATSDDGKSWNAGPQIDLKPRLITEKTVAETAGTVGFVERVVGAVFERDLPVTARFVRLELRQWKHWTGRPIPAQVRLEVLAPAPAADDLGFAQPEADDATWERVGIPHCFNDLDTYQNAREAPIRRGVCWYRRHLQLGPAQVGRRLHLLFEGVNVAAAVHVNGHFMPGLTAVPQPGEVTHVGGFLPFSVDITDAVRPGDNVLAVRVSNRERSFFTWPGFGVYEGFCMGWGGIVCPLSLVETDSVHIPLDVYARDGRCGSYLATTAATSARAEVRHETQVANDGPTQVGVVLETRWVAPDGATALELRDERVIAPGSLATFAGGGCIEQPRLWWPNASPHGRPELYRVVQRVLVDGRAVDAVERQVGLRRITWDADYAYVNGERHLLNGYGHRNAYPALGSAVPADIQWRDMRLIAEAGANTLRIGHVPPTLTTIAACDELGILAILNSGDNEWALHGSPADIYKPEYDRAMIVAFRNHPAVAIWEANNGIAKQGAIIWPSTTKAVVDHWDSLQPRIVLNRDCYPAQGWDPAERIVVGYTNTYRKVEGSPSLDTEVYGARWDGLPSQNAARFDWDNEKQLATWFIDNHFAHLDDRACGWLDWMLAETQGEGYTVYLNGLKDQRSLGSSALDGNRLPKLKYRIFAQALWTPYALRPGVALQSHWNLAGVQNVDAWSNCPAVVLRLNGRDLGVVVPHARTRRCTWHGIPFEAGTLTAIGLDAQGRPVCRDERVTAGEPAAIRLEQLDPGRGPGGRPFVLRANGSDAAIITATVVDAAGRWCPHAGHALRFAVSGPGVWRGSYNFYATPGQGLRFHSPGDTELCAEGGQIRVAVRTACTPGDIVVSAGADGLSPGSISVRSRSP